MGFIRGVLIVLVSVLLFLSLISTTLFLTLSMSLQYDHVEKNVLVAIDGLLPTNKDVTNYTKSLIPEIQEYCGNKSSYVFSYEGQTVEIPCEIGIQGQDVIIDEVVRNMVYEAYYAEYDCGFLDCMQESEVPFFLISQKAQRYWDSKFYLLLAVSIILAIGLFFLTKIKSNALIITGSLMIASALPFIKLDSLILLFTDNLVFQFLKIFFSESYYASLNMLCLGILVLIIGIVFKIFKLGFKISEWISKLRNKNSTSNSKSK